MTVIYAFCRYSLISNAVFAVGLYSKLHNMSCDTAYTVSACFSVLGRIGILTVLGVRTCAVLGNHRVVVGLFSILGLFVVALAIAHVPRVSCSGVKVQESRIATDLLSVFTVVYELLATALMAYGCHRSMIASSFKAQKNGLAFFMLKEGLLYSGFVTFFTTTAMILNYGAPLGSFFQRLLNALTIPISGIMAARFLLHVRERQQHDVHVTHGMTDSQVVFQVKAAGKMTNDTIDTFGPGVDVQSIKTITDDDVSDIYAPGPSRRVSEESGPSRSRDNSMV